MRVCVCVCDIESELCGCGGRYVCLRVCVCVRCVDLSLLQVRLKELENATGAKMQNTPISTNRYVVTCSHHCTF